MATRRRVRVDPGDRLSGVTLSVRTVRLRGLEFTWYEGGVRDAPPVLLLHGLGRDGTDWLPVWHGLGAAHRLLALDQRGHGGSARPPEYSFGLLREDAVALLDALDVSRVGLVGHSMGGTVACLLAQEHPGRVDRLVLEDTPPPRGRREYQPPPEQPPTPVSYDWRMAAPLRRELAEPDPAWWQRLARITAPSLVLGGGPSSHIDQAELAAVAAAVPDCRLVTIPDAGHSIHARRPAEFLAAVVPFLT
jgi:pimeloyl-ACP methyl ester carboxylesterase